MEFNFPYDINKSYTKSIAYFSMEFAIDQALKIYSGGLGFLAGSHMRSAYDLKQNLVGIGLLWKYGYYDQVRQGNNELGVLYQQKHYPFLKDTGIILEVLVNHNPVKVKVYYLAPEIFGTAPMFLLSTEHDDNDHLAHTITHRLYDNNLATRIAQYIILGVGGVKLMERLKRKVDIYHFNEAHALPAAFYLQRKHKKIENLKKHLVFTTHTPVKAGNENNDPWFLHSMGFFDKMDVAAVENFVGYDQAMFNHSLAALRMSKKANAVSKKHGEVSNAMWKNHKGICEITSITNAQNAHYWTDKELEVFVNQKDKDNYLKRKSKLKKLLFEEVADQTGKLFDPNVLTIVWARRFAGYKRASLITRDLDRFTKLMTDKKRPFQIIFAGKPYPQDEGAIQEFNRLVNMMHHFDNGTVLTGYELRLSALMKKGSDIWLNNPRVPLEASGTSGMTAAMNGSINFSTDDGWILEFAKDGENSFVIPQADQSASLEEQDKWDLDHLYDILEKQILPKYYDEQDDWVKMSWRAMKDVKAYFDSGRMAEEYYKKLYK